MAPVALNRRRLDAMEKTLRKHRFLSLGIFATLLIHLGLIAPSSRDHSSRLPFFGESPCSGAASDNCDQNGKHTFTVASPRNFSGRSGATSHVVVQGGKRAFAVPVPIVFATAQNTTTTDRKDRAVALAKAKARAQKDSLRCNVTYHNAGGPGIPHRIFFTYQNDILESREPAELYALVSNTTAAYRSHWNEPNAPAVVLDDDDCRCLLNETEPRLLPYFEREPGIIKGDICRVAALYVHGGHYFDADIQVLKVAPLDDAFSFVTSYEYPHNITSSTFFPSYLSSKPRSPILRRALQYMFLHYSGERPVEGWVVSRTLRNAFDETPAEKRGKVKLMHKLNLNDGPDLYPEVERQREDLFCNHVLHDPEGKEVYFFLPSIINFGRSCGLEMKKR